MTSHTLSLESHALRAGNGRSAHTLRIAAIADNLNNVLTVISAHAALLKANVPRGDAQEENLDGIKDGVQCAGVLTRRLLLIADNGE